MQAIQVTAYGTTDVLQQVEIERPAVAPDGLVVEVEVAGVNYLDVQVRRGQFEIPTPFTAGFEGAGTIVEAGAEVAGPRVGQRIVWSNVLGSYAQFAAVPATNAVVIPDGVDATVAVAAQVHGITAQYLTTDIYPVAAGDTVVVHAAAGGVGQILVQLAKARGARVVATVSSDAKAEIARSRGADLVVRYEDLVGGVAEITDGAGADVVFDGVGIDTYEQSVRALRVRGTLVIYGEASGPVPAFDPAQFGGRSVALVRPNYGDFARTAEEINARASAVFDEIRAGRLEIETTVQDGLGGAAAAQTALETRASSGKVVIRVA